MNFAKSRNVIIAALILVLSIAIKYSFAGAVGFMVGELNISFSGPAVEALAGIILNAVLPGKDYKYNDDNPDAGILLGLHQLFVPPLAAWLEG